MYFYHHLQRGSGKYVERPDGLPVIFQSKIDIELEANQAEIGITQGVRLLTQYVAVGLWVEVPQSTPQLITERLTLPAADIYSTCQLDFFDNTALLEEKLSLLTIQQANDNGIPYYLTPRGFINLSDSRLFVWNNSGISANTAIRLKVDYVIPTANHKAQLENLNI